MMQNLAGQTGADKSSEFPPSLQSHWTGVVLGVGSLAIAAPAFAHHPLGGQIPSTSLDGFLSGLGHPLLGADHFAFVVALGLLTALLTEPVKQLLWVPISFAIATLLGVGMHLLAWNIPAAPSIIASTVIVMGAWLALRDRLHSWSILGFGAIAGLFHGYAYGESIIGAEQSPLLAYLIGLTLIQVTITITAFGCGRGVQSFFSQQSVSIFRYAGLIFGVFGLVLLGNTFGL